MKRLAQLVALLVVLLIAATAGAQDCPPCAPVTVSLAQQEWWQMLLSHLVEIVASAVLLVVPVMFRAALAKWATKLTAEKQLVLAKLFNGILLGAVAYAEEQARKALREGSPVPNGVLKLDLALEYTEREIQRSGLPSMVRADLERLLESRLQLERGRLAAGEEASPPSKTENAEQ